MYPKDLDDSITNTLRLTCLVLSENNYAIDKTKTISIHHPSKNKFLDLFCSLKFDIALISQNILFIQLSGSKHLQKVNIHISCDGLYLSADFR